MNDIFTYHASTAPLCLSDYSDCYC